MLRSPLDKLVVTGFWESHYLRMWEALKMGIDPITYNKMKKSDFEMLSLIESLMIKNAERRASINAEVAKVVK